MLFRRRRRRRRWVVHHGRVFFWPCEAEEEAARRASLWEEFGFSPNYSTYSWLVDGYCNQNKEEDVLRIPNELTRRGVYADKSIYKTLIRRLCKRGFVDCAHSAFIHMQGKGFSGDSIVYISLALGYLHAGKSILASEMLDGMGKKHLKLSAEVYNSAGASYSNESSTLELLWNHATEEV